MFAKLTFDSALNYLKLEMPLQTAWHEFAQSLEVDPLLDRGEAHITVITPPELRMLVKDGFIAPNELCISSADLKLIGLGRQTKDKNAVYFVVVEWESAQNYRKSIGLPRQDFHITVAFRKSDIHNLPKDRTTLIQEKLP